MKADVWYLLIGIFMLGGTCRLYGAGGAAVFVIAWILGGCFQLAAERRKKEVNRSTNEIPN